MTKPSKNKQEWRQKQLEKTLSKTRAVLESLAMKNGEFYPNMSRLANEVASIVGVDPSLYRKSNSPHKELLDAYAVKLCAKLPKSLVDALIPEESILIQLSEAKHRISVLETILNDLSPNAKPLSTVVKTETFLHEFEVTCMLVEAVLEEDQYLYFDKGRLMTRATMTAIPAELADAKTCKPFVDWHHARNTSAGSLSTDELEKSLRRSTEGGVDDPA